MKKSILLSIALMFAVVFSKAQTTAMQFSGQDCNGNAVDLFADLDAGKAVVLFYYMPNCGSCPPPAKKIKKMADNVNFSHPGMVKGYAFPYQNSTDCAYSSSWVSSNLIEAFYAPMDSGAAQVAHYGGFGMPTVVVVGGADHRVLWSTLSFSTSDTTIMRDSILAFLDGATAINDLASTVTSFNVFPNPTSDNVSITLDLKQTSDVSIEVIDMTGKQVAIIRDEKRKGLVTKQFSTSALPNGNYFVRLQVNGKTATQKLTVNH